MSNMTIAFRYFITITFAQYFICDDKFIEASYKKQHSDLHQTEGYKLFGSKFDSSAIKATEDLSKLKLILLVNEKIDTNKDKLVQLNELVAWIKLCQEKYDDEDFRRHWNFYMKAYSSKVLETKLRWEEYLEQEYKHLLEVSRKASESNRAEQIKKTYEDNKWRDLRRWKAADLDKDEHLSMEEFKAFTTPEKFEHMKQVVVDEQIDSTDVDQDGKISLKEYLANQQRMGSQKYDNKMQQVWIAEATKKFSKELDMNQDGFIDGPEIHFWLKEMNPTDNSVIEAQYLMKKADIDHDRRLTNEEILQAYTDFVHSHATDFGEALVEHHPIMHDEL